jgi:hypothetical protein
MFVDILEEAARKGLEQKKMKKGGKVKKKADQKSSPWRWYSSEGLYQRKDHLIMADKKTNRRSGEYFFTDIADGLKILSDQISGKASKEKAEAIKAQQEAREAKG